MQILQKFSTWDVQESNQAVLCDMLLGSKCIKAGRLTEWGCIFGVLHCLWMVHTIRMHDLTCILLLVAFDLFDEDLEQGIMSGVALLYKIIKPVDHLQVPIIQLYIQAR